MEGVDIGASLVSIMASTSLLESGLTYTNKRGYLFLVVQWPKHPNVPRPSADLIIVFPGGSDS